VNPSGHADRRGWRAPQAKTGGVQVGGQTGVPSSCSPGQVTWRTLGQPSCCS
jgi:hypothetical protein